MAIDYIYYLCGTKKEKRILVTKAIGDIHEKMAKSGQFERAFIATGTLLPVNHLIRHSDAVDSELNIPTEEAKVKLQHFEEYNYSDIVTPKKVHDAVDKIAADKAVEEAEKSRLKAIKDVHDSFEELEMKPFVETAERLIPELENKLTAYIEVVEDVLKTIHRETGFERFLVAGSWSSFMISKVLTEWDRCIELNEIEFKKFELVANDIDIYHGPYSDEIDLPLHVDLHAIKKIKFQYQCSGIF